MGTGLVLAVVGLLLVVLPAAAATPHITHQASASGFPAGSPIFDFATLGNGSNPTGSITFTLFGPDNDTCAGPPIFTDTKTVNGNGNYQSGNYVTDAAGDYQWIAAYSGDVNNDPATTACGDPAGRVTVAKRVPNLSHQASPSVPVGGQLTDTATLGSGSGPAGPTGTLTFALYGPANPTCVPPAAFSTTSPVTGNGMYTSDPYTPTVAGDYQWVVQYTGDANNRAVGTTCVDPAGFVTVTPGGLITPTLTTQASGTVAVGGEITDAATLAGGTNPSGSITFTLYGPDDDTCADTAAFTNVKTVSGNATYTSDPFTTTAAGTYRWVASYSGDIAHNPVTGACDDPNESVEVTGGGSTTTSTTTSTVPTTTSTSTSTSTSTTLPTTTSTSTTLPTTTSTSTTLPTTTSTSTTLPTTTSTSTTLPTTTSTSTTLPTTTSTSTTLPTTTSTSTTLPTTTTSTTTTIPTTTTSTTTTIPTTTTITTTTLVPTTTTTLAPTTTTTSTTLAPTTTTSTSTTSSTTTTTSSTTTTAPPTTTSTTTAARAPTTTVASGRGAATATTTPGAPSVQVNPSQGPPGQSGVLSGSGFGPNEPLTATFNSTPVVIATLAASPTGTFSIPIRIPADAVPGRHTIVVAGSSGRNASTGFTVVATGRPATAPPLARTGADPSDPIALAACLLVLGNCALLVGGRRRLR